MAVFRGGAVVLLEAAVEPPLGQGERLGGVVARRVARRALVEGHHDVGADHALGVDDALGGEQVLRPVDVGAEVAPLLLQFAARREREDLESAAVGEHGPLPGREAVHAPGPLDDLHARTHVEMVGVGQDDLRAGLLLHVAVEEPLDRGGRAHGHEDRGAHRAVVGGELAGARPRRRILVLQGECHTHIIRQK